MKPRCPACVKHIGSALFVLVVLLLSLEAGLRMYDDRTGKVSGRNEPASPLLTPSRRIYHRLKPMIAVDMTNPDTGKPIRVVTNSLGLRGREYAVPKPPGVYRVLVLGDDTTFAAEVADRETACAKLQTILQTRTRLRVEVVNAGVPGYCPLLSYLLLKHSLLGLQPDLIVMNFDMSDVADDHNLRRYARLGSNGEPLLCRHPDFDSPRDRRVQSRQACLLRIWCQRQIGRLTTSPMEKREDDDISSPTGRYAWVKDRSPNWSVYIRQTFSTLDSLQDLSRQTHAEFVVAVIPSPWQISGHASNAPAVRRSAGIPQGAVYRNDRPFELLKTHLASRQVPFCNPVARFRAFPNAKRLYFDNAPRLTTVGQELFARELAGTIFASVSAFSIGTQSSRHVPAVSASSRRNRSESHRRHPRRRNNR